MDGKTKRQYMTGKDIAAHIGRVLVIIAGCAVLAVGFSWFLVPIQVAPGGFAGLAALISYVAGNAGLSIPVGLLTLALNLPLYLIAFGTLGNRHGIYSILGVVFYTMFIDLFAGIYPHINIDTTDKLLSVIYGGVLSGIGLGLILKMGGTTGGSDMLSTLIVKRVSGTSVGAVLLIVDAIVVSLSIFVYDLSAALYAFIAIFITTVLVDYVVEGARSAKAYYIISQHTEEITQRIFTQIARGVTLFPAKGMYTGSDKDVLLCIVTRTQIAELKSIVKHADPNAFMFSTSVKEVVGEGFMAEKPYIPPPGRKKKR